MDDNDNGIPMGLLRKMDWFTNTAARRHSNENPDHVVTIYGNCAHCATCQRQFTTTLSMHEIVGVVSYYDRGALHVHITWVALF